MDLIQLAVFGVQVLVLGLTYWMLETMRGYLKDFGRKAGFGKDKP